MGNHNTTGYSSGRISVLTVRVEYAQKNNKWFWKVFSLEDGDTVAEARSQGGYITKEEAEESYKKASCFWVEPA